MTVMKYFEAISEIPRASFQEKAISDYLKDFAEQRNLKSIQDDMFNIIIFKEASKGYEDAPTVMLQSHIDMVAEKNKDSNHDFDKDPLTLITKDGVLWADNTTLGADNGVGVAYMMALLDDKDASHPALECVFTVQEETGLTGAANLDTSMLESTLCVGLDSSGDTETCVSTSGGVRGALNTNVNYDTGDYKTVSVAIRGLLGGHSGGEIDQERANANKIAGIILHMGLDKFEDLRLVDIDGGLKVNAITRENDFTVAVNDQEGFLAFLDELLGEMKIQYKFTDSGLDITTNKSTSDKALTLGDTKMVADTLFMLPYGVIQKSKEIKDLVITSANIGTVNLNENNFEITISLRATQAYMLDIVMEQVRWIASQNDIDVEYSAHYPGWNFDSDSKFRAQLASVYKNLRNEEIEETATHGGMELGIWKSKMPDLDIISFGPNMHDIHTPNEHLEIESFNKTYELLVNLLASLNNYNGGETTMKDYKSAAKELVKAVGGKKNISALTYCVTRLRFILVHPDKLDEEAVAGIETVKTSFTQSGQFQVAIGNDVKEMYDAIVEIVDEDKLAQSGVRYE